MPKRPENIFIKPFGDSVFILIFDSSIKQKENENNRRIKIRKSKNREFNKSDFLFIINISSLYDRGRTLFILYFIINVKLLKFKNYDNKI